MFQKLLYLHLVYRTAFCHSPEQFAVIQCMWKDEEGFQNSQISRYIYDMTVS